MADMSMCARTDCPRDLQCRRRHAPITEGWQSWTAFPAPDAETGWCQHFVKREEAHDQ